MKNLFYILIAFTFVGCKTATLKVTIESQYSSEAYLYNTITQEIDTIKPSGNTFVANPSDLEKPTLYYLMFDKINDINRPIYIILSKQETHIKFYDLIAVNDNSKNIKDVYPNRPLFMSDPNKNGEFYRFQDVWIKFYHNITKPGLIVEDRKQLYTKFLNESENIIKQNKNKLVSAFIIDYLMDNNLIELDRIQLFYSYLEPNIQKSFIGQKIKSEVGFGTQTLAPKFSLRDYHGNNYSLDSLKGRKVLLHFWSSSCAPCMKEIPDLLKLAKEKNDLVIINISLDTDQSRWISGIERLGITDMINFCDFKGSNGEITSDYHIKSIPANYLIDERGRILIKEQTIGGLMDKL